MMDALPTSMGQNYSGSLTADGRVFVWGLNGSGQLGDGSTTKREKPVEITAGFDLAPSDKIQSLHFGANHSAAISSLNRVFIWGWNYNSRLGFNDTTNRNTPTEITSLFNLDSASNEFIQSIRLGWASSFALTSTGRVFSWGENSLGQLGDGTFNPKGSPVDITSKFLLDPNTNEKVTYLSSSYESMFALTSAGKIFAWGDNTDGKLGDDTTTNRNTPTNITSRFGLLNDEVIQSISSLGLFHTVVLTNQSRVFTFGNNSNGQLGNGSSSSTISKTPIDITSSFSLSGGETIQTLTGGASFSIITTSLGRIMSWGGNFSGQLGNGNNTNQFTPVNIADQFVLQNGETIKSMSLGYNHSFAVTSSGRLFGWGINSSNQLGDGLTASRNIPFVIPVVAISFNTNGGNVINSITAQPGTVITAPTNPTRSGYTFAGWFSDEALTTSYTFSTMPSASITLYAKWTGNAYSISYSYRTIQVQRFNHLTGGTFHSVGMTTSGQVYAWGLNDYGQLGDGTTANKPIPTLISFPAGETIKDVVAGQYHSFAVTTTGRVYAWGRNDYGQLGDGTKTNRSTPTLISFTNLNELNDGETIRNVVADQEHSLAVTTTGRVYAWGRNNSGQLGDNTLVDNSNPTLILFPAGETMRNVAAGLGHSLAVTTTGQVFAWGRNAVGQLGDGTPEDKSKPTLISFADGPNGLIDGETMRDVVAGGEYSHAVTTNGRVYSWGSNNRGQLGDGTKTNRSTPTLISFTNLNELNDGETIRNVDIGGPHSMAVTTTGRVYAWGLNNRGQLGNNTLVNNSTPTLISFNGLNDLNDGETIRNVFLGGAHSMAVTTNNRLYAWGWNNSGQLGDNTLVNKSIPTLIYGLTTTLVNNYHTVNYGDTITSTLPNPTLAGHTFVGWFMDEALTVQYNLTTMPAENVILYASFTPTT